MSTAGSTVHHLSAPSHSLFWAEDWSYLQHQEDLRRGLQAPHAMQEAGAPFPLNTLKTLLALPAAQFLQHCSAQSPPGFTKFLTPCSSLGTTTLEGNVLLTTI